MITFGTWSISGEYGYVNLKEIDSILSYALESGVRDYDTAPNYGNGFAEFCLGNVFNNNNKVLINTKFGSRPFDKKSFDISHLEKSFYDSLYRLRRSSINILWLHNPRNELDNYDQVINLSEQLKSQGLINKIGISLAKGYQYDFSKIKEFDEIQVDCSLLDMDVIFNHNFKGKNFHARSPLYSGVLSGALKDVKTLEEGDHRVGWLTQERLDNYNNHIKNYTDLGQMPIVNLSRRFLFSVGMGIDKIIFGIKDKSHIDDILKDYHASKLEQSITSDIIKYYKEKVI